MPMPANTTILAKVDSARRRLIVGRFGRSLNVTLFAALLVSTIAIMSMAIVPLEQIASAIGLGGGVSGGGVSGGGATDGGLQSRQWIIGWLAGTSILAIIVAAFHAWWQAPSRGSAAAEVDRRFGLRERLSSSLAVSTSESDKTASPASPFAVSPFADALQDDAARRAESLRIRDKFPLNANRMAWLPLSLVPILAVMILVVEPADSASVSLAESANASEVRQVKSVAAELKKRIAEQRRASEAKGLQEAKELFENMERQLDRITSSQSLNRKDALIQLNEIKDQIQERKDRIGSPEQLRRTLSQMKGLEGGPAEKIAEQIQKGDFGKAAEEIRKLAKKLEEGKLSEKDKEKLAEQAKQLAKQMSQAVQQHEQKKEDLKQKIEQAKREGRSEDAAKMQQKLNQAEAADSQMQQMQQMAQAMQQASEAMEQGDSQAAADAMKQMSEELGDMQSAMEELEDLQSALDDLSQSKEQMNCKGCSGEGCQQCMGNGFGQGEKPGSGMGEGAGKGDRPEEKGDTNTYDTQVRGEIQRGRAVIAGIANGPNRKGVTRESIKNVIESSMNEESDPLEDQVLPRDEREQTRQYFDRLREGG